MQQHEFQRLLNRLGSLTPAQKHTVLAALCGDTAGTAADIGWRIARELLDRADATAAPRGLPPSD